MYGLLSMSIDDFSDVAQHAKTNPVHCKIDSTAKLIPFFQFFSPFGAFK